MKILKRQEDSRGWIEFCEAEGQKFNVLFSKAGSYRSGDYHKTSQHDIIVFGTVEVRERSIGFIKMTDGPEAFRLENAGHSFCVYAGYAHLFHFRADTLMIEWWDGEFEAKYYKPYRDIVDESLKRWEK